MLAIAVVVVGAAIATSIAAAGGNLSQFANWQEAFGHLDDRVANLEVKHSIVCATLMEEYDAGHRRYNSIGTEQDWHDQGLDEVQDYLDRATSGTHYETRWTRAGAEAEYNRCTSLSQATPTPTAMTQPTPRPTHLPTATPTSGQTSTATCMPDDYDRDDWGDYPAADASAAPRWTLPADNVNSPAITQDHHVALEDAHTSGGCNWSIAQKDAFSSDAENLNPTTRSFNSSKSNRTPDQLTGIAAAIIDTSAEKCDYATQHDAVKDKYDLTMADSERTTVTAWLALCP